MKVGGIAIYVKPWRPNYTERQKDTIFFRSTLTKIHFIKMHHPWTQISCSTLHYTSLTKTKSCLRQKGENALKSQRMLYQKSQKMFSSRARCQTHTKVTGTCY